MIAIKLSKKAVVAHKNYIITFGCSETRWAFSLVCAHAKHTAFTECTLGYAYMHTSNCECYNTCTHCGRTTPATEDGMRAQDDCGRRQLSLVAPSVSTAKHALCICLLSDTTNFAGHTTTILWQMKDTLDWWCHQRHHHKQRCTWGYDRVSTPGKVVDRAEWGRVLVSPQPRLLD